MRHHSTVPALLMACLLVLAAAPATTPVLAAPPTRDAASTIHTPAAPTFSLSQLTVLPVPGYITPTVSGVAGALTNVRGDLHGGGILAKLLGTFISGGVKGAEMGVGVPAGLIGATRKIADPAFLLGNLPGGVIGGALGAAIPLPARLSRLGLSGEMLRFAPPLLGAMFGSALFMHGIDLWRDGRLTVANLVERIDVKALLAQSAGIDIAIVLSRVLLPSLMLGPICLTEVGAALVGGWLATKVVNRLRNRTDRDASATLATGIQGTRVPSITGPAASGSRSVPPGTGQLTTRMEAAYRAYIAAEQRGETEAARTAHRAYTVAADALQTATARAR